MAHRIISNVFHNSTVPKISACIMSRHDSVLWSVLGPRRAPGYHLSFSQQSDDMRCNDFYSKQLRNPNIRHLVSLKIRYPEIPRFKLQTLIVKIYRQGIGYHHFGGQRTRWKAKRCALIRCSCARSQSSKGFWRVLRYKTTCNVSTTLNQKYLSIFIVCMYGCMDVYTFVCLSISKYVSMHVCLCLCLSMSKSISTSMSTCMCICVCMYVYIAGYVTVYIHFDIVIYWYHDVDMIYYTLW